MLETRHYEWILFDLSGVLTELALMTDNPVMIRGSRIIPSELEKIYSTPQFRAYMLGELSHDELVTDYLKQRDLAITVDEFSDIFKQTLSIMPGLELMLEKLHRSHRLAVLTNEGIEWANWKMEATKLPHLFEKVIISAEIKKAKPDEDFYLESLRQLKTEAKKCIFVDDTLNNIKTAEMLGMSGILFTDSRDLGKRLKTLGVEC